VFGWTLVDSDDPSDVLPPGLAGDRSYLYLEFIEDYKITVSRTPEVKSKSLGANPAFGIKVHYSLLCWASIHRLGDALGSKPGSKGPDAWTLPHALKRGV